MISILHSSIVIVVARIVVAAKFRPSSGLFSACSVFSTVLTALMVYNACKEVPPGHVSVALSNRNEFRVYPAGKWVTNDLFLDPTTCQLPLELVLTSDDLPLSARAQYIVGLTSQSVERLCTLFGTTTAVKAHLTRTLNLAVINQATAPEFTATVIQEEFASLAAQYDATLLNITMERTLYIL